MLLPTPFKAKSADVSGHITTQIVIHDKRTSLDLHLRVGVTDSSDHVADAIVLDSSIYAEGLLKVSRHVGAVPAVPDAIRHVSW